MIKFKKTISILLEDESTTGIRYAAIPTWTGKAISCPRTKIRTLTDMSESKTPGVYFLFGIDEKSGQKAVYIGEAENVSKRLPDHIANKDFWNEVILLTDIDSNLTKSHVKYLESKLINLAKDSGRYTIINDNTSQSPILQRGGEALMDDYIKNFILLLGVLGHKTLEPLLSDEFENDNNQTELYLKIKEINANAYRTNEGIVVLTGSYASKDVNDSLSNGYKNMREQLFIDEILKETTNGIEFTKDQLFKSSSQAASIIVGYPINGRITWKTIDGTPLKDIEETN